jgi:SAM-dependent methyltransferase
MIMDDKGRRINIGCGITPTIGWLNYDNSLSVRLAKHTIFTSLLVKLGVLEEGSRILISIVLDHDIKWADAAKHIPLPDNSIEVLYTSHMIEHLHRETVTTFLREAYRILESNGIIRIVVPDLRKFADKYIHDGDADAFVEKTLLVRPRPNGLLNIIKYVVTGDRHHLWMYDGPSMCRLLVRNGFREPRIMEPGYTLIPNPGKLNLYERADESVYVEAVK